MGESQATVIFGFRAVGNLPGLYINLQLKLSRPKPTNWFGLQILKRLLGSSDCSPASSCFEFAHRVRIQLVTERKGMALGVLTQPRGPHQQPTAYLSRELDVIARGWPHCLKVIGATALLTPEALKIINGQNLTVLTSHDVSGILNSKVNI